MNARFVCFGIAGNGTHGADVPANPARAKVLLQSSPAHSEHNLVADEKLSPANDNPSFADEEAAYSARAKGLCLVGRFVGFAIDPF